MPGKIFSGVEATFPGVGEEAVGRIRGLSPNDDSPVLPCFLGCFPDP
jgi:hypothetical protein